MGGGATLGKSVFMFLDSVKNIITVIDLTLFTLFHSNNLLEASCRDKYLDLNTHLYGNLLDASCILVSKFTTHGFYFET